MICSHHSSTSFLINRTRIYQCDLCGKVLWARKEEPWWKTLRWPAWELPTWSGFGLLFAHVLAVFAVGVAWLCGKHYPSLAQTYGAVFLLTLLVLTACHVVSGLRKASQVWRRST